MTNNFQNNRNNRSSGGSPNGKTAVSLLVWLVIFLVSTSAGGFVGAAAFVLIAFVAALIGIVAKSAGQPASGRRPPVPGAPVPPARPARDVHLCDPGQHSHAEDKAGSEALEEMQPGYVSYAQEGGAQTAGGHMTREAYQKKLAELKDLRDAGIISDEEYRQKSREYAAFTR